MKAQHVLIISYVFPPLKGIGGRRWAKFAKYLERRGYTIHVIHNAGGEKDLGSHWSKDVENANIKCYPIENKYPAVLGKRPLTSIWDKLAYRYWKKALPRQVKGNFYDKCIFWRNDLLKKCQEIIEANDVKKVIATGAPFRLLYFATELKPLGVNLIGDFRDPWTWSEVYGYPSLPKERMAYEKMMERKVIVEFDKILSPAPAILDHLKEAYPEIRKDKFVRIPHAFDQDDLGERTTPKAPDGKTRMIYAGSMYGAKEAEAYFSGLLKALNSIKTSDPKNFKHFTLDLFITGHGVTQYEQMVQEAGLQEQVHFKAPLPAKEIFKEILNSDYVLLFIPSMNKDFMGTKFSEIFSLGVPLLHVGAEGYVSRFIEEHNTGYSFRVAELEEKLRWVLKESPRPVMDRGLIKDIFDIELITDQLEKEVLI